MLFRSGIIEIPSIGDLLAKIALEPMRVEDAYEIVHTVLSIAPNQMAIWVAINEAHVPYNWGIIREIVNGVFRVAIGVIVAILSTIAFFGFILWLFTL